MNSNILGNLERGGLYEKNKFQAYFSQNKNCFLYLLGVFFHQFEVIYIQCTWVCDSSSCHYLN